MAEKREMKTKEEKQVEQAEKDRKREILIAKFENNPVLYDKENPSYKDAKMKGGVIAEIAQLLEWTPAQVKACWRSLRDRFKKEKRSVELKSGAAASTGKQWKFYDSLKFLEEHLRKRTSLCTTGDDGENVVPQDGGESDEGPQNQDLNQTGAETESQTGAETESQTEAATDIIVETNVDLSQVTQDMLDEATTKLFGEPAPKKQKKDEGPKSQSLLTPQLPSLSPADKRGVHAARSKAKKEADLDSNIKKALSNLEHLTSDPLMLLGESIGTALKNMKDDKKRSAWKRKLRIIVCDIEEGLGPDES